MPFTNAPWSNPTELDTDDYCEVCLVDQNEPGETKVEAKCKLPIRSSPDAPINTNALRAVFGALRGARGGVQGLSPQERKAVARKVRSYYREAGLEVPAPLDEMAS
jgi:hypothetical protein